MKHSKANSSGAPGSRLPERLRGVLLPEICQVHHLVDHTGLPGDFWEEELRTGRLRGRYVTPGDVWLIHRHAVAEWLNSEEAGPDVSC